ncbi:MAG: N-acetyltransferase [Deltaproteobacteria bacterium]|nr:N-acetyltransferase [Deltaproteobacteria bacterium]
MRTRPFILRKARMGDIRQIHALLMEASAKGELLPRSFSQLYSHLRDFFVIVGVEGGEIGGCCALSITWEGLAEVRSLIVADRLRRQGWGRRLVEACLSEALTLGVFKVFTLTYQVDFFAGLGFEITDKNELPQKVWAECLNCPKFPDCDETAMLMVM